MRMKRTYLLIVIFIFLMLIVSTVNASITVTVTAPSSVTQGSNVPIIASFVAGESGDSGTFYFSCDQTVSGEADPEAGYNIMSSTSKTYTFTPNTAQTYSNCKVTDGGTQYSSSFAINVVAPSTLTVSGSPGSTTNSSGDTFTLSISVTNPTASDITTSYSLSCPSGYTCSGDQTSDTTTISAGTTTNLQWTVTVGSSSATITFQLGSNSNAFASSVTVSTSATTTTPSSSEGGGGGGGGTTGNKTHKKTQYWTKITPGAATIMKITDPEIGFKQISITVKNPAQTVTITVTKLDGKPASVTHEITGKVYKYIDIDAKNINETHLDNVKIQFEVNNSWINANNIDPDTIALNRYRVNAWERLQTRKTSEDSNYTYYEADTTGFSTFAISGELKAGVTTVVTTTPVETTMPAVVTTTMPILVEGMGITPWIIVIVIIIIAIIGFFLFKKRKVIKP